jgi:hypothetical protein
MNKLNIDRSCEPDDVPGHTLRKQNISLMVLLWQYATFQRRCIMITFKHVVTEEPILHKTQKI